MSQSDQERERAASDMMLPGENTILSPGPAVVEEQEAAATVGPSSFEQAASGEPVDVSRGSDIAVEAVVKERSRSPFKDSMRRLKRDTRAMISLGVVMLFVFIALFGPFMYQHIGSDYTSNINGKVIPASVYHGYAHQEPDRQDEGPSGQYWLGTDDIGRDMLARAMQGMLVSVSIALIVELIDIFLGVTIGVLAGYYGGWIDQFLARFADLVFAFPGLLFVILLVGILGTGTKANAVLSTIPIIGPGGNARLLLVSVALAFTVWPLMARYVRGQTLQMKEQQFIEAARTSGTKDFFIIVRHIIPNLLSIVIIASTLNIVNTIINEAGISLLGLGVQSPGSSIGLMISDGTSLLATHPWVALFPCGILIVIVLALSYLSDGLRDAFDPRSKG